MAQSAADDRRNRLRTFLNEFRDLSIPVEFIEVPPVLDADFRDTSSNREFGNDFGFWNASRLYLQLNKDHSLLLERVTDALVCLLRTKRITQQQFPYLIRLERVRSRSHKDVFPWRVVIVTEQPSDLLAHFSDPKLRDWLGIGIDFVVLKTRPANISSENPPEQAPPPLAANAQGRCVSGSDGLEGTVGGVFEHPAFPAIGVTCRHVLSSECGSLYWPTPPIRLPNQEFTADCPDAAFIQMASPCFAHDRGLEVNVVPATQADVELAVERRTAIQRSKKSSPKGVILFAGVSGFRLGNHFYRGPHFEVTPYFVKRFGIIWPLHRRFSQPGDSGSWIVEQETRQWFGMIVGGFEPPNTMSVAVSAEYLVDAFNRFQMSRTPVPSTRNGITMSVFA